MPQRWTPPCGCPEGPCSPCCTPVRVEAGAEEEEERRGKEEEEEEEERRRGGGEKRERGGGREGGEEEERRGGKEEEEEKEERRRRGGGERRWENVKGESKKRVGHEKREGGKCRVGQVQLCCYGFVSK